MTSSARRWWPQAGFYLSTQDLQGRGTDVTAFDPRTGKRLWQTLAAGDEGQIAYGDGRLYVLGEVLSALDARTGAPLWSREAVPGIPTPGPGVVIVPTGLGFDGGIAVIDGATGAIRWSTAFRNGGATRASDGRRVYATWSCGRVVAMDIATGAVVWEAPCLVPAGRIESEARRRPHPRARRDGRRRARHRHRPGARPHLVDGLRGLWRRRNLPGDRRHHAERDELPALLPLGRPAPRAHARGDLRELWRFSDGSVTYDPLAVAGAVVLPTEQRSTPSTRAPAASSGARR